jgi:hypothetical protein
MIDRILIAGLNTLNPHQLHQFTLSTIQDFFLIFTNKIGQQKLI